MRKMPLGLFHQYGLRAQWEIFRPALQCIVKATFKSALFTFAKDALTAIQGQTAALLIHKNCS
jgi:hypothetical protein